MPNIPKLDRIPGLFAYGPDGKIADEHAGKIVRLMHERGEPDDLDVVGRHWDRFSPRVRGVLAQLFAPPSNRSSLMLPREYFVDGSQHDGPSVHVTISSPFEGMPEEAREPLFGMEGATKLLHRLEDEGAGRDNVQELVQRIAEDFHRFTPDAQRMLAWLFSDRFARRLTDRDVMQKPLGFHVTAGRSALPSGADEVVASLAAKRGVGSEKGCMEDVLAIATVAIDLLGYEARLDVFHSLATFFKPSLSEFMSERLRERFITEDGRGLVEVAANLFCFAYATGIEDAEMDMADAMLRIAEILGVIETDKDLSGMRLDFYRRAAELYAYAMEDCPSLSDGDRRDAQERLALSETSIQELEGKLLRARMQSSNLVCRGNFVTVQPSWGLPPYGSQEFVMRSDDIASRASFWGGFVTMNVLSSMAQPTSIALGLSPSFVPA